MNREEYLGEDKELFLQLMKMHSCLDQGFKHNHNRTLSFNDTLVDRWEKAEKLGFGKGSSIYDSTLVIGEVSVGDKCWIGPFTVIDGSGGLSVGNHCTISTGVQIYTHDNVMQTLSSNKVGIERESVNIGNNVYIGPNVVISKGVSIGDFCVIGANSFVNKTVDSNSIVAGQPSKLIGEVKFKDGIPYFKYSRK